MGRKKKTNINEISVQEFIDIVGKEFLENEVLAFVQKTMIKARKDEFQIKILRDNNRFDLIDQADNSIIIIVQKKTNDNSYFCKPIKLLQLFSNVFLEEFRDEIDDYCEVFLNKKESIIDQLFFQNELPIEEKLSDYFYYVVLLLIKELNLESFDSCVSFYDNDTIIVDALKHEIIFNKRNEVEYQEVIYMINLKKDSELVRIVKIYENNKKETIVINIPEFISTI